APADLATEMPRAPDARGQIATKASAAHAGIATMKIIPANRAAPDDPVGQAMTTAVTQRNTDNGVRAEVTEAASQAADFMAAAWAATQAADIKDTIRSWAVRAGDIHPITLIRSWAISTNGRGAKPT